MSHMQGIIKLLKENTGSKNLVNVFSDFVHLGALCFRNTVDTRDWQARESEYMRIINQYTKEQAARFSEILALYTEEMTREPRDVLGELYMRLEMGSKDLGQCFTPWHVARLMAAIIDTSTIAKSIAEKGYATIAEPAAGAGAMAIATVEHLRQAGFNPQQQIHVTAEEINSTAAHMVYMQLSILGIPAIVHHRNTLTMETFASWPTPMHILGNWVSRLQGHPVLPGAVLQDA